MSERMKFIYKGNRSYVHGTSLFNALEQAAKQRGLVEGKINVTFKQMIINPICVLEQRSSNVNDSVVANFSNPSGEDLVLCINEASETILAERQQYNETEVCKGAMLGNNSIMLEKTQHIDKIEVLVSLCKKMHKECINNSKKWVFSRYDGCFPIPTLDKVEIKVTKKVGTRLTCSDVIVCGKKIGNIYFS